MLHASNPTLKIPEEQDPIGRANVELKSLASILYELRKQLQYGSGDLNFAFLAVQDSSIGDLVTD